MSRVPLTIEHYMTRVLVVVGPQETIAEASRRMRLHQVRHLPVVEGGKVVGILSQRDIHLIQSLCASDPHETLVEEAMVHDVYRVEAEDDLRRVAAHMAEHRLGSAVVAHDGKLLGVFTTTDALRALAALLTELEAVDSL
jgi:acetoin utilization protein AcuB